MTRPVADPATSLSHLCALFPSRLLLSLLFLFGLRHKVCDRLTCAMGEALFTELGQILWKIGGIIANVLGGRVNGFRLS